MAGKYTKDEIKAKLNLSAYHLVATSGIESMTTRKISSGCGLSDPYIYQCYSDLGELAAEAFFRADSEIVGLLVSQLKKLGKTSDDTAGDEKVEKSLWFLWCGLWKHCMDNAEKIIFCYRFEASGYYSKEIQEKRTENYELFSVFMQREMKKLGHENSFNVGSAVVGIVDFTVSTAAKIHLGYIDADEISPRVVYNLAFSYIYSVLGVEVGDDELI